MATDEKDRILTKGEVNYLLEPQCSQISSEKIKVLVVEDDRTTQLLYDKGLFNQIFDKKIVVSGREALFAYKEWHPDIIVLDVYLPEMTGYQVLKAIRTTIADKKTTVVMGTSLSGNDDVLSCMQLGIEGYIVKPFQCMDIGVKVLSYYAKKEPDRARKAETLCREIAKQSQINLLLDKDKSKTKDDTEGVSDCVLDAEIGESGGDKEAGETSVGK